MSEPPPTAIAAPSAAIAEAPPGAISRVPPVERFHRNTSRTPSESPATRFDADEANVTKLPSAEIELGTSPLAALPSVIRSVAPVARSRTNTSATPLTSPATRFVALDVKTTYRPSAEIIAFDDAPSPCTSEEETLTLRVAPEPRLRRKTSLTPLVSPATSEPDAETNTALLPSADSDSVVCGDSSLADAPVVVTLSRSGPLAADAPPASATDATSAPAISDRPRRAFTPDLPHSRAADSAAAHIRAVDTALP